jgi:hypothetical protein
MRVSSGSEKARIAPQSFSTIPNATHLHLRSEGGLYPLCAEHLHHLLHLMCGASCTYDAIHQSPTPSSSLLVCPAAGPSFPPSLIRTLGDGEASSSRSVRARSQLPTNRHTRRATSETNEASGWMPSRRCGCARCRQKSCRTRSCSLETRCTLTSPPERR